MNKYSYLYVLQGNYGYGFEDLTATNKNDVNGLRDIKRNKREYLENQPGIALRIIQRRELNS